MRLWITRDVACAAAEVWAGEPRLRGGCYVGGKKVGDLWGSSPNLYIAPGTCIQLYPESDVRKMVAEAVLKTCKEAEKMSPAMYHVAWRFIENPTDTNWHALEAAIWPERSEG